MFEFFERHYEMWKSSWQEEKERRKTKRQFSDKDFLPAAIEIMEKPASPVKRAIAISIMAFFTIAVIWSVFGKVDVVAVAVGQIIPSEKVKIIQPPTSGTVSEIFVRDGDLVEAGQILLTLDTTLSASDEKEAFEALRAVEFEIARGEALLSSLSGDDPWVYTPPEGLSEAVTATEKQLIQSRIEAERAGMASLLSQKAERESELQVALGQLALYQETLPLVEEQLTAQKTLLDQGLTPRLVYSQALERAYSQRRSITAQQDEIKRIRASITTVEEQIIQARETNRAQILLELSEAKDQRAILTEQLLKARQLNKMQSITSPVAGVVQQLAVNARGAVVEAAQPLLIVVPREEELVVEAMVLNKDVGFVSVGDKVAVKLEAFPFTKYGTIPATLESLSMDAIEDEQLGLVYLARVILHEKTISVSGRTVALAPGMVAISEIKTDERRLIEFLLSPLLRYKNESLRER